MARKQSDQDSVASELFSLVQIAEIQSYEETETVLLVQYILVRVLLTFINLCSVLAWKVTTPKGRHLNLRHRLEDQTPSSTAQGALKFKI